MPLVIYSVIQGSMSRYKSAKIECKTFAVLNIIKNVLKYIIKLTKYIAYTVYFYIDFKSTRRRCLSKDNVKK